MLLLQSTRSLLVLFQPDLLHCQLMGDDLVCSAKKQTRCTDEPDATARDAPKLPLFVSTSDQKFARKKCRIVTDTDNGNT